MNDQTEVSSVESNTSTDSVDSSPLPIESFFEGTTVRSVKKDGEFWFVASDIAKALDVGNASQALARLDDEEKGIILNDTLGGAQEVLAVNEFGLYSLILTSRKKSAKKFKKWVTQDLLPTLRKEGSYHMALKAIPSEPWSLEEIDAIVDRELPVDGRPPEPELPFPNFDDHLPQATLSDEEARVEQGYRRESMRTSLQVLRAQYGILLSKYPHFESCVKQASNFGNKDRLKEAEALQEESEKFCKWAWAESMRLGLGPDDLKAVDGMFDIFWRVNFAELFKKHFRKDWQLYIEDERAKLKPYEVSERQRHLYRFK